MYVHNIIFCARNMIFFSLSLFLSIILFVKIQKHAVAIGRSLPRSTVSWLRFVASQTRIAYLDVLDLWSLLLFIVKLYFSFFQKPHDS